MGVTEPLKRVLPVWLALLSALLACTLSTSPPDETTQRLERAPLVLILAPVNGSTYVEGTRVALQAIAQDSASGVARLEFRMDDIVIGTATADDPAGTPSLLARAEWIATEQRKHLLTVEAFRADGSSLGVSDISLQVIRPPGATELAPTSPPDITATPSMQPQDAGTLSAGPVARINVNDLNVRAGPGTTYPVLGTLVFGTEVPVTGRIADGTWVAISFNGTTGWIFAELAILEGDLNAVPVLEGF
jgi:hypothetical protein